MARIKQEEEKLQSLKENLKKDQFTVENNPDVYKLEREIKSYVGQKEALSRFSYQLKCQKDKFREHYTEENAYVTELKENLKELTRENLQISYAIEELKNKTLQNTASRSRFLPLSSKYSVSNVIIQPAIKMELLRNDQKFEIMGSLDEVKKIKKEIKEAKEASQHLSNLQGAFLSEQKKFEEFFQDCLQIAKQKLLQNQQMPQINRKGLAGSLFFDLIQSEKSNLDFKFSTGKPYKSTLQESDCRNVLYYTVKNMVKSAKVDQRRLQISKIQLTKDDFSNFTSLQVLGLLCLRSDIQVELHLSVFPANLLHIQHYFSVDLNKPESKKPLKSKKPEKKTKLK